MKYLKFENGDLLPAIGLGTWKSAKGEVYTVIREAIEVGYRHFDCAYLYGNETEIGTALFDAQKCGDVKREELFITSKIWNNRHRKEQTRGAIETSLKDLKLDYLDLYLIHWPVVVVDDKNFPESGSDLVSLNKTALSETWEGLVSVKDIKLTKHIGVSNFSIKKIEKIWKEVGVKPEVNQVELHPYLQQRELKKFADRNEIVVTAYAPLGSLDRPASRKTDGEPLLFENEILKKIAESRGISTAQLMLAWAVNYGISAIPKTVNKNRLIENLAAVDVSLKPFEMDEIEKINLNNRYIKGDFWCLEGSDYTIENLWDEG